MLSKDSTQHLVGVGLLKKKKKKDFWTIPHSD